MIMKKRILLACYISAISICLSESSTQKSLGEVEALIQEYVDDLANKDDGVRIASYEDEPLLFLGGLHQRGEKREQGSAGLWGRKRQNPTMWEEQNHTEDRTKKSEENERREKRTDSSSSDQKYGKAGIWGKRQSDDPWEERETQKSQETGLWGKRATKGSRKERKASKQIKPQGNIGLWQGKRSGKVFNPHNDDEDFGKRIRQTGNTGLWGTNRIENKSGRKRFSGRRKKTAYGR